MAGILPTLVTILIILFLLAIYVANFAWYLRKEETNESPKEQVRVPQRYINNIACIVQDSKAAL